MIRVHLLYPFVYIHEDVHLLRLVIYHIIQLRQFRELFLIFIFKLIYQLLLWVNLVYQRLVHLHIHLSHFCLNIKPQHIETIELFRDIILDIALRFLLLRVRRRRLCGITPLSDAGQFLVMSKKELVHNSIENEVGTYSSPRSWTIIAIAFIVIPLLASLLLAKGGFASARHLTIPPLGRRQSTSSARRCLILVALFAFHCWLFSFLYKNLANFILFWVEKCTKINC